MTTTREHLMTTIRADIIIDPHSSKALAWNVRVEANEDILAQMAAKLGRDITHAKWRIWSASDLWAYNRAPQGVKSVAPDPGYDFGVEFCDAQESAAYEAYLLTL